MRAEPEGRPAVPGGGPAAGAAGAAAAQEAAALEAVAGAAGAQVRTLPGLPAPARWAAPGAFLLTAGLLTAVQLATEPAGLLLERFLPGGGWLEAGLLAAYAAWLAGRLQRPRGGRRWRGRVWRLFSLVFFGQLVLGLAGWERLLMTGRLHLPVPAMILAGPLWRGGEGLFMVILLGASLLLVGPAWCSWLCYLGAWDDVAARRRRRPLPLPARRAWLQGASLLLVTSGAWLLHRVGAPAAAATLLGAGFGLAGLSVMVLWSRRRGAMAHCTAFCPIGLVATRVGRLSPFRLRVAADCSLCGACLPACRYGALEAADLRRGRPGASCTLCGDCVPVCPGGSLQYRFGRLRPAAARALFITLVVSLHAAFLGVARI